MYRRFLMLILSCLLTATAAAEGTVYVKANKAKLMAAPEFNADLMTTIDRGAELTVKGSQGRWLQVGYQDKTGWVSQLLVGDTPPLGRMSTLNSSDQTIKQEARRRASATASVAAARGLRNDERARQSDNAVADYSALEQLDRLSVNDDEALKFVEEGTR